MDLDHFWTIVMLIMYYSVEFFICMGVYGCGWTIYSSPFRMMTPYFALRYRATTLASTADDIKLRMMVDSTCTATVLIIGWTCFGLFVKNNFPSA